MVVALYKFVCILPRGKKESQKIWYANSQSFVETARPLRTDKAWLSKYGNDISNKWSLTSSQINNKCGTKIQLAICILGLEYKKNRKTNVWKF